MASPIPVNFRGITREGLLEHMLSSDTRVMLFGAGGLGKTHLAAELCRTLHERGRAAYCLSADIGNPGFGVPGAVNLAEWTNGGWRLLDLEAVCSLDAARFRLPLVMAAGRVHARQPASARVVDAPGLVRGAPAAEFLEAMVQQSTVDLVVALLDAHGALSLVHELSALSVEIRVLDSARRVARAAPLARTASRSELWAAYLTNARELTADLEQLPVIGTPPPIDVPSAWRGRQVGLGDARGARRLAEIVALEGYRLRFRAPAPQGAAPEYLLVRDARREGNGCLVTAKPLGRATVRGRPPPDVLPVVAAVPGVANVIHAGSAFATLVNGVIGDPLLHLRLRQPRRSLLLDLGDAVRLPARIAHQVTDIFITHAHLDHIGGFLWLLRSRLGAFPVCRMYGPPGLAQHVEGLLRGILWDRIGEHAPHFEVLEVHGERLLRWRLKAGVMLGAFLGEITDSRGILLDESEFKVRGITLDHGTPVLAFAFEQPRQVHIRKKRLAASGLPPGGWLRSLKAAVRNNEGGRAIQLPDGTWASAAALADDMVQTAPGCKLVYATDFADTAQNRESLRRFAANAHVFFCEASFLEADRARAQRTGHLTARACGEIAASANVGRLVPFHFSRRYQSNPEAVYAEVEAACRRLVRVERAASP